MEGWIKLHRNILEWRWITSSNHLAVFTTLLLRATHKESSWRDIRLSPGQLITGRKQLSSWTGLSEMQIRTILKDLVTSGEINQQITSKFSIITIANWEKYQQDNQQITSNQPTSNQQVTTFKNAKNAKKNTYSKKNLTEKDSQPPLESADVINTGLFTGEAHTDLEEFPTSDDARNVLNLMNSILFTRYGATAKNLRFVNGRLAEGYKLDDFKKVFEFKLKEWDGTEFSKYLRPSTLLSPRFDEYLSQAENAFKPKLDPLDAFLDQFSPNSQEGA
jgi:uncharacterized phage protein (TIGR02220 family)